MTTVVTGAGSGIGRATAELLLDAGEAVVGVDVEPERLEWLDDRDRAVAVAGDVGTEEANADMVSEAIWHFGSLDALVLNAGISHIGSLERTGPELIDRILRGVFWGLKHGPARMADGGSIILTSSISAVMGTPFEGLYGAAKAGVSALARSAAIDLGHRGIRVNAVQPGPTWTPMNPMPERLLEIMAPAGRKGRVEDLVGVYEFLASDASRYVTGQAITVDGGVTVGISQALMGVLAAEMAA